MNNQLLKDQNNPSGPVKVKDKYKVWVDRNICIGAATCVAVSSKSFQMDNEAKAVIVKTIEEEKLENIIEAAKACPVAAIFIEDEKGNRIFPK